MSELAGMADRDRRRGTIYPSPFFDIAQTYMPPTVKELFRWCRYFFYKDPMIGSVVTKIAEYPVTDFVYNHPDKHVREWWKRVIEDELNTKPFLIEIGLDFFTYGNAFVSMNMPFTRFIVCSNKDCKAEHRLDDETFEFKLVDFRFKFACPKCKQDVVGTIKDQETHDTHGINYVRWSPTNIEISYNPITGRSKYRYKIPNKVRQAIMSGDRSILVDLPAVFLDALRQRRDIMLSEQNLFHFKRPTLAEEDMGWGKPLIIHSMSRMFYLYVLRRAQEAIALQRIMPLEFIFPQANSSQDPYQHVNLSSWSGTVQDEIRKWRQDPNYISVVAVPLGFERLGGDGRALLLGPEIDITNKEITGGMGVPLEFVFGGLSWSGSSVSLRTLENHFLSHRRLLLRFVNWVKQRLVRFLKATDIRLDFTEFKMADDVQQKQIVIQLNAANKISDATMLTQLGFDHEEENKAILKETEIRNRIMAMQMKAQAEAQGEAQVVAARYQARANEAFQEASGGMAQPGAGPPGGEAAQVQVAPQDMALGQDYQMAQDAAQQQAMQVQGAQPGAAEGGGGGGQVIEMDASRQANKWATQLAGLDPARRQAAMNDLQSKLPNMARLVQSLLSQRPQGGTAADTKASAKPLPQVKPPNRKARLI